VRSTTHTKIDMHEVLLRIWDREQQTVLFVTHDLGEALTLADRIILFSGASRPGQGYVRGGTLRGRGMR